MSKVIEAVHVTKSYPVNKHVRGFKEWVLNLATFKKDPDPTFTAIKSINLNVEKGECLGIVGKNGAGKSTLLSLLLGTSHPTQGEIRVTGKRTPLLELGAGFHPDLTGKENVILNAVLLGLTRRQVADRLDQIVRFSEIEPFIDMPVRTYSSGMYLRLAFSVAIHTEPEIMLIDEVLAVGDESFQKKSEGAIVSLIKSGVTTVFVSHNLDAIKKICNRAIWLHEGKIRLEGKPEKVIQTYVQETKN